MSQIGRSHPPETLASISDSVVFLKNNCLDCHQGTDAAAGLDLTLFETAQSLDDRFASWVRIVDRVNAGEMPPPEVPQPKPETRSRFVSETSAILHRHQQESHLREGRVRGRRLTNLQLERTLQDLLGIDIPLASLMSDESRTETFATIASGQAMSHFQLQQHLQVVDAALDEAFRRAATFSESSPQTYSAGEVARENPKRRCREPEMIGDDAVIWSSRLIFYGRLPVTTARQDGWYRFRLTMSARNKPSDHGVWCTVRTGPCISSAPLLSWVTAFEATDEPREMTFDAWMPRGHMLEVRPGDMTLKMARFEGGQVGAGEGEPQNVAGVNFHSLTVERIHRGSEHEDVRHILFGEIPVVSSPEVQSSGRRRDRSRDDDGRAAVQLNSPDPAGDLEERLKTFAGRAFRRPVTDDEVKPFIELGLASLNAGQPLTSALHTGYRAILCSSRFLYFQEMPGRLDDYAIASRLSYFLWNSMPDDELMTLAGAGRLQDAEVLNAQVDRLLADARGRRFVPDLAAEWLDLRLIDFTEPDPRLYPTFDVIVQQSMQDETLAFLQDLLERNASVTELIDSDQTFLNSRLARFYDIDRVAGDELQLVRLQPDDHRGGLLTQGAILKVTANGTTTSPVIRGVWIGERLLGEHIPPPPQGVPAIEPDIRGASSIRDLLARHRNNDSCASCHVKIDPPGFALENYDPSGRYRKYYGSLNKSQKAQRVEVDPSYELSDGQRFETPKEFFALITAQPEKLAHNFASHLLSCGTGARPEFADRDELQRIVSTAAKDHYGVRSLLKAVVTSSIFLTK